MAESMESEATGAGAAEAGGEAPGGAVGVLDVLLLLVLAAVVVYFIVRCQRKRRERERGRRKLSISARFGSHAQPDIKCLPL